MSEPINNINYTIYNLRFRHRLTRWAQENDPDLSTGFWLCQPWGGQETEVDLWTDRFQRGPMQLFPLN